MAALLLMYAITCLWNLMLFHLKREHVTLSEKQSVLALSGAASPQAYSGLFNHGFFLSSATVGISTIALGSFIFLMLPRWSESSTRGNQTGVPRHLTGFSEQVKLGQMGEILENDSLVMTVELLDGKGNSVESLEENLFRGVTLVRYENGQWIKGPENQSDLPDEAIRNRIPSGIQLIQKISLESTDSEVLFSLSPVRGAFSRQKNEVQINRYDGTLRRTDSGGISRLASGLTKNRSAFNYEVISIANDQNRKLPSNLFTSSELAQDLLQVPKNVADELATFNRSVLSQSKANSHEEIARSFEKHLRDSGQFVYSLKMAPSSQTVDPVLDFLISRKQGHCEYFASALALQLRVAGIPSRLVNGFKGGEWNALVRAYSIREKHAHSWVEAQIKDQKTGQQQWITLDPTPGSERDTAISNVSQIPKQFRTLADALRYIWTFYVIGFDSDRQKRVIYEPLAWIAWAFLEVMKNVWNQVFSIVSKLIQFQSAGDFFSLRGFLVSVSAMLLAVATIRLFQWLFRKLIRKKIDLSQDSSSVPDLLYFQRMTGLFKRAGLVRNPAETPREFALRAEGFLKQSGLTEDGLAAVPHNITESLYQVRFGKYSQSHETAERFTSDLDLLEQKLQIH